MENQLQRRNDLIPNLVETVKGIAQQEQDVFGRIADSRAKLAGATTPEQQMQAANEQTAALARLLVVVENYPQLKSNEQFARLMDELAGTENRIAVERMRYNERVQAYNTSRRQFPSNITASLFGFKEHALFDAPKEAEALTARELRTAGRSLIMAIVDSLLPEFDHEMTVTRKLLERVPEERFGWKPHEKSYTLGQLAQHVATVPMWGSITINQSELDLGGGHSCRGHQRAALLALFDGHVAGTRAALVGKSDAELMAPWTLKHGGKTLFSMPKAAVWRSFVMSHLIHHRGQLSVYLRIQNVPLPSMYGPSADENPFV